jgi:hypothetical protein
MLRKIVLMTVLVVAMAGTAHSQALLILLFGDKLSTEKVQVGINFMGTLSNIKGIDDTKMRPSWAFGAFCEIKLADSWTLQPELIVKTPGGAKNIPFTTTGDPSADSLIGEGEKSRTFNYLTVPIFVKYRTRSIGIYAGPQFGYLTSAKDVHTGTTVHGNAFTVEQDVKEYLNKWDAGIGGGFEYSFKPEEKMRSMRLGLRFYWGLVDMVKDNPGDAQTNYSLIITVGIPIGGSKDAAEEDI